jgi:hypothetical protein
VKVTKSSLIHKEVGGAPPVLKKRGTRNGHNAIVVETTGGICKLAASWIFGNIAYVLVRIMTCFLYTL